jgi:hypothetical protein
MPKQTTIHNSPAAKSPRPHTPKPQANRGKLMAMESALLGRKNWSDLLGQTFGGDRDIYEACGWKKTLTFEDYKRRFDRQDVAARIVSAYPDATWKAPPDIREDDTDNETPFEIAFKEFARTQRLWHYLNRVDTMAGVGSYAVLLLGLDGGGSSSAPAAGTRSLLFLQPYYEDKAEIKEYDRNKTSKRYGLPDMYSITPKIGDTDGTIIEVHHSRIIHVAEGLMESDIFGIPRLQRVFNRLEDIEKLLGGSAEAHWKQGFPGMALIKDADADWGTSETDMEDEIEEFYHNLTRYMRLSGMKVQEFTQQINDPEKQWAIQISAISAASQIPVRILLGSERGELASSQDANEWMTRVDERRQIFAGPMILRPFIERMIQLKILPEPKEFEIVWPEVNVMSAKDKAEVGRTKSETIAKYAGAPGAEFIYPLYYFLTDILDVPDERAKEIQKLAEEGTALEEEEAAEAEVVAREDEERRLKEERTEEGTG